MICEGAGMGDRRRLPEAFCRRMKELLGTEYEAFQASYDRNRYCGLRRNPLKGSAGTFEAVMPYLLEPVSWAREGYYYRECDQPGRDILHEAGAYYIQEPSAMAVAEILDPMPGERILDLCAAPGGKSTQIAGRMNGEGLLVANEVIAGRAQILSQNVERMGIRNCVVCNETPERMAVLFPAFFDRIVVDAPCSGEGMFRKDETAVEQWSAEQVRMCAGRQGMILDEAAKMLKPGGVMVYSTCTFAPDENEEAISRFLQEHEDFMIEGIPHDDTFAPGRADWISNPVPGLEDTMRLWPHRLKGEGHYIARMRRKNIQKDLPYKETRHEGRSSRNTSKKGRNGCPDAVSGSVLEDFFAGELGIAADWLKRQNGSVQKFGGQIYLIPDEMIPIQGIKVVRPGLHIGTEKKNRLEPSHSLALALKPEETGKIMELTFEEAVKYLHGESLPCTKQKGWTLLSYQGYPIGFGKAANGQMKNHYPKGLRK